MVNNIRYHIRSWNLYTGDNRGVKREGVQGKKRISGDVEFRGYVTMDLPGHDEFGFFDLNSIAF